MDVDIPIAFGALDTKEGYFYMLVCPTEYTADYFEFYGSVDPNVPMETIAEHFAKAIEFYRRIK